MRRYQVPITYTNNNIWCRFAAFYGAQSIFSEERARRSSISRLSLVSSACAKRIASLIEEAEAGPALPSEDARSMGPQGAARVESPTLEAVSPPAVG